jgi:hypothetical protein
VGVVLCKSVELEGVAYLRFLSSEIHQDGLKMAADKASLIVDNKGPFVINARDTRLFKEKIQDLLSKGFRNASQGPIGIILVLIHKYAEQQLTSSGGDAAIMSKEVKRRPDQNLPPLQQSLLAADSRPQLAKDSEEFGLLDGVLAHKFVVEVEKLILQSLRILLVNVVMLVQVEPNGLLDLVGQRIERRRRR